MWNPKLSTLNQVNGSTFVLAALNYDGVTYAVASKLYRWTGSSLVEVLNPKSSALNPRPETLKPTS